MALLEADVALPVVRDFINEVKARAIGEDVNKSLTGGKSFSKLCNELENAMGKSQRTIKFSHATAGSDLDGGFTRRAGKTTSVGKLAQF